MAAASEMAESKDEVIEQEQGNSESHGAINNCTKIQEIIISEIERIQAKKKRPELQSLPQAVESRYGLSRSVCEAQIQKMLNKGVLKNVMSRGAKSLMLVKNGDVVNVEKQKEIKENNEEQLKEKHQETSIENPRSRRAQEKPEKVESPSNMDEALNVGKSDVKDTDGTSDSQYTTAVNKMNDKAEVLTDTSNHVRETSQNQVWSSIRGLTDSLTKTNELLQKEREYSRKLEKEILDLKMRLFEQEIKTAISKDNEDSLWTESNAGLRATKYHIPGRLATNIEFVDSSSSLSSDEEDMNEWTTRCTGKREAPRKQAHSDPEEYRNTKK